MQDDGWYTKLLSSPKSKAVTVAPKRAGQKKEPVPDVAPVEPLFKPVGEEQNRSRDPPDATVARRAKSYGDFQDIACAHVTEAVKTVATKREHAQERRIKTGLDFSAWYEEVEPDLLEASHEQYQLCYDQLHLVEQHLDSLQASNDAALRILQSLSTNFKAVDAQTAALQAQCEDLMKDQKRTKSLADDIAENLQYYTYLEPMTRRLNAPGARRLVGGKDFLEMLSNLDACLDYMQSHPNHRESSVYGPKYRLLLTRSLTLIRNHFADTLKEVAADVSRRVAERQLNDTTQSAILYAKFRLPASELKQIGLEIQKRAVLPHGAEPGSEAEYQSLMNELFQSYSAVRGRLLRPIISKKMTEIEALPSSSKDLVSLARSSITFIEGLCADEYKLWNEWFNDDRACYDFLETLIDPFYDRLRPRIIHEVQLQRLCELCTDIQTRYVEDDDDEPESPQVKQLDFAHLITPLLEDAQSRLVFLALKATRDQIENFRPKPEDLDYPKRTREAESTEAAANAPILSGRKNSNGTLGLDDGSDGVLSASLQFAYPTLRKAVWLLSRIYRLVHSSVFDDLAHQIVHQTTMSLEYASSQISRRASPVDAQLFLIRHMLELKQQIIAFDIEFVSPDVQLDFSSVTSTFWELRSRGGLFNPLNLVRLVGGSLVPKVVTNMLDAKAELDGRLRTVINEFVDTFAKRMMKPLLQPISKDIPSSTSSMRQAVQNEVPSLRKKLEEYLPDARTRETLVAAVMDKVVEYYEDWHAALSTPDAAPNGGRKGKGREDDVWSPGAFGEWAAGEFNVGMLGYVDDDDDDDDVDGAGSRRGSDVGSL